MAHDPKLEIYTIKLTCKEPGVKGDFRDLFRLKLDYSKLKPPITDEDIFKTYHQDFLKEVAKKDYNRDEGKKKGFTIAYEHTANGRRKQSRVCSPFNETEILTGILDGGHYGRRRNLGIVEDTTKENKIKPNNVVGDLYYFLIYTPLNHNVGVVMIQAYSQDKISDVFCKYLEKYFKIEKKFQATFTPYFPDSLKDKYLNGATFDSFKFSTGWIVKGDFDELVPNEYELNVKVGITDKNLKKVPVGKIPSLLSIFGKSKLKIEGGDEKELGNFKVKNAKIENENRKLSVELDNEDKIRPVLFLKDYVPVVDGMPDFDKLESYCKELLEEIKEKLLPENAIADL